MKRTRTIVLGIIAACLAATVPIQGQDLSLQQCLAYGKAHSLHLQRAVLDAEKYDGKVREGIAGYLPQVNATGSWTNNLQLPTQILPGAIFGQPGQNVAVQFGTKYNVSGSVDVSQVVFNKTILTGIKAAKASEDLAALTIKSTEEDLIYNIASAFYNTQIIATQRTLLESNLRKIDTMLTMMKSRLDRGFAKQTDVDRLTVNHTNIETDLKNLSLREEQQTILLKFYMGMPIDTAVRVASMDLSAIDATETPQTTTANTTEMRLMDTRIHLSDMNIEAINAGYYPTLSMVLRGSYQAQQNEFNVFTSDAKWFPTALFGLTLNVPIFDGFSKSAKAQQAEVDKQQLVYDKLILDRQLQMRIANARNTATITSGSIASQERNVRLADEVYRTTRTQYEGGISTLSDLLNAETSIREAQTNYARALLDARVAELDVLRSSGNISSILQ